MSRTESSLFDSEGFAIEPAPTPAYRLSYNGAALEAAHREAAPDPCSAEARAQGCTCRRSPQREAARAVGLAWAFAGMDCPVHGER